MDRPEPEVMESLAAAFNYEQTHKHTRTKPITVPTIICQMMWTEHRRDQSEKQRRGGVQLPDPLSNQRRNVIHRQPPGLN